MGLITVDLRDRKQLYEQLIDNVKNLILMGELSPDEKLPSVRSLARELGINPNTIQKAYAELERRGITYSVPGRGSFVSPELDVVTAEHRERMLRDARTLFEEARAIGMRVEDFMPLIGQIWKEESGR